MEDMRKKWQPLELHKDSTLDYAISDIYKLEAENKRLRELLTTVLHYAEEGLQTDEILAAQIEQALNQK